MRKESLINEMKGNLPAHPYPSHFERIKGSKIRAQLLLFKNKTKEKEEKDKENCKYLLKGCVEGERVGFVRTGLQAGGQSRGCYLGCRGLPTVLEEMRRLCCRPGHVFRRCRRVCQM